MLMHIKINSHIVFLFINHIKSRLWEFICTKDTSSYYCWFTVGSVLQQHIILDDLSTVLSQDNTLRCKLSTYRLIPSHLFPEGYSGLLQFQHALTFLLIACANTLSCAAHIRTHIRELMLSSHCIASSEQSEFPCDSTVSPQWDRAGSFYQTMLLVTINVSDVMSPSSWVGMWGGEWVRGEYSLDL